MAFGCRGEWSSRRALGTAACLSAAVTLALPAGKAFADASIPPEVTPVGSLSAGVADGGVSLTLGATPPAGVAPPLVVAVDTAAAQPVQVATAPVAAPAGRTAGARGSVPASGGAAAPAGAATPAPAGSAAATAAPARACPPGLALSVGCGPAGLPGLAPLAPGGA